MEYIKKRINVLKEKNLDDQKHISYTNHIQNDLTSLWQYINKKFHKYNKLKQTSSKSFDQRLYTKIKQKRAEIYYVFRKFEAVKQKLLKDKLISIRQKKFKPLGKFEKFIRILFLIITFPIHAIIFILVKTLMKFFHCFFMGFEIILKFVNGCANKKKIINLILIIAKMTGQIIVKKDISTE